VAKSKSNGNLESLDVKQRRDQARAEVERHRGSGEASVKVTLRLGDARELDWLPDESIHLVVCSPPYWTLKKYNDHPDQLGHVEDYENFLDQLDKVWTHALRALVPGGRLVCVVGDVCLSRKRFGRHLIMPLHADIVVRCRKLGFDNLNPIIWHKIANANFEVENGSKFLGKPYEPNAIIKNDIEFILMQRKPGGYRSPSDQQRKLSMMEESDFDEWFQQFWNLTGASTREHPAPFPLELANRLVRMFSFHGDTVLDPFAGTGTTLVAAAAVGRNALGVEIDRAYFRMAEKRLRSNSADLFRHIEVEVVDESQRARKSKAAGE
jgi:modification methylase